MKKGNEKLRYKKGPHAKTASRNKILKALQVDLMPLTYALRVHLTFGFVYLLIKENLVYAYFFLSLLLLLSPPSKYLYLR